VSEWLFWEQEALFPGVGRSRFFARVQPAPPAVMDWFRAIGEAALDTLEAGLAEDAFLAGSEPTIADLATYSYARLAEEANFDLTARPRVRAWREVIEALPGWAPPATLMPA
jgi:glutathione S-transferase